MPNGYTRQSVASIVNGNIINASDSNNEYNSILAAFDLALGHIHDGTTVGGGAPILAINGVAFPSNPSTNTVPVITGTNTVTYETVPNAALANSSITIGSTSFALGSTHTTVAGLTLTTPVFTSPSLTNATIFTITGAVLEGGTTGIVHSSILSACTTAGTTVLGGALTATGQTITGGTYVNNVINSSTINLSTLGITSTSGVLTLGANMTATGNTINGGTTAILNNFVVNNAAITGSLSGTISSGTITGGTFSGPTISSGTLTSPSISGATLTGTTTLGATNTTGNITLGANLIASGNSIVGGTTSTLSGFNLSSNNTAVTQSTGNNTTALATTAFVQGAGFAPTASPTFTGTVTVPTPVTASNTTVAASTAYVQNQFNFSLAAGGSMQIGPFGSPIIKWGKSTTSAGGAKSITFSPQYLTALVSLQITPSNTGLVGPVVQTSSESATGFTVSTQTPVAGNAGVATDFYWMAIGY